MKVGTIVFGQPAKTATFDTESGWSVSSSLGVNKNWTTYLNDVYSLKDYSPADGVPGVLVMERARQFLGGLLTLEPREPGEPGTVY